MSIRDEEDTEVRKSVIVTVVVIVIVLVGGGALLVAHNNSNNNKKPQDQTMNGMDMGTHSSTDNSKTATNNVTIENFAFSPANITVKKGTTVTWTNKDSATHTISETDGQAGPNSGNLPNGKSYSFTYNSTGTFKYGCSIHPDMIGTVTVTN